MITLKNVSKKVMRDNQEVEVLSNINLQLGNKGLVVLRGGKEAGKTCLLRMIAQLDKITDGNIFVDGVDIGQLSHKEIENYRTHYVGMLMDKDDILPDLTIEENIVIGTAFGRIKPKKDVLDMLYSNLQLSNVVKRKAKECTDDEKVCANIARLMIKSPKVILVDDFESILEADTMLRVWRLLKELSETHLVVIISDSQPYISKFADRVITMNMGKVIGDSGSNSIAHETTATKDILDKTVFLKKHRFTLNATGKIVKQMFYTNGKSMILTMLLSLILVVGFIVFSSLSVFNAYYTLAKSSIDAKDDYIEFYRGDDVDNRDMLNYDNSLGTSTVIAELQKENLSYFCAKHDVDWDTNIGAEGFVITSFITNSQEIELFETNKFGQKLLSGKYTGLGAIANDDAHGVNIVISDYMAELIIKNGITGGFVANQNATGNFRNQVLYDSLTKPSNYEYNNLQINGKRYNICGIYETDFDKYVENDLSVKKSNREIFEYKLKNVYSVIHVNTNFFTMNPRHYNSIEVLGDSLSGYTPTSQYKSLYSASRKIKVLNTGNNMNLSQYGYNSDAYISNKLPALNSDRPYEVYVSSDIAQSILLNAGVTNKTLEDIVSVYSDVDAIFGATGFVSAYKNIRITIGDYEGRYTIAGVIGDASVTNTIIMQGKNIGASVTYGASRSAFEYLYIANNFETNGVVMPVNVFNASEIENVISLMAKQGYSINTLASASIASVGSVIDSLRFVFVAIAIACVAIIMIVFIRYIHKLFMHNTKMLGLLRSLGCTRVNISVSIMLIAVASMAMVLLLGWLISLLVSLIGNAIMASIYSYAVSIFNINVIITLIMVVMLIAMPCGITPFVCQEFQSLMPLYMLKYDEIYGKKKDNNSKDDNMDNIEEVKPVNIDNNTTDEK